MNKSGGERGGVNVGVGWKRWSCIMCRGGVVGSGVLGNIWNGRDCGEVSY